MCGVHVLLWHCIAVIKRQCGAADLGVKAGEQADEDDASQASSADESSDESSDDESVEAAPTAEV